MTQKLVSKEELKSILGVPYSFRTGEFPNGVQLGACRVAWAEEEVQAWIDGRIAIRNAHDDISFLKVRGLVPPRPLPQRRELKKARCGT